MSAVPPRVLLVDDDTGLLRTIQVLLEDEKGWTVEAVPSAPLALEKLRAAPFDVLLTDLSMPGGDGLYLLREARALQPELPVLLMTAFGSVRSAVEAMKLGAAQYLTKPVDPDELILQVERSLDSARLAAENRSLRERAGDPESFDLLVGESPSAKALRGVVARLAAVDSTVLVRGETGTGKELVARLVHRGGPRSARPFIVVNCTAIPHELFESELFGHERGAFTGAGAPRTARSRKRTEGRSSSTRSVTCRRSSSPSFSGSCRTAPTGASEGRASGQPTCGSSPRRTGRWKRRCRRVSSAPISSTGWPDGSKLLTVGLRARRPEAKASSCRVLLPS